jgi:predicted RNA-binding protein with PIN domain
MVDGANVMHAWPELRRLLPRQRNVAREQLVERLQALHDSGLAQVQVVFDGRGPETVVESRPGNPPLIVVHTATGQTADDVIEQLVAQAKDPGNCTVATADRLVRQTIEAAGGSAISPEELAAWIARAGSQQSARLAAHRRANDSKWRS